MEKFIFVATKKCTILAPHFNRVGLNSETFLEIAEVMFLG